MTPDYVTFVRWAREQTAILRWAREQGWRQTALGIRDGSFRLVGFDITVDRANGGNWILIKSPPMGWWEPASPQQAIDVLCALGLLPARFSSQWKAGRDVAIEAVAAAVLLPDSLPDFVDGHPIGLRSHA